MSCDASQRTARRRISPNRVLARFVRPYTLSSKCLRHTGLRLSHQTAVCWDPPGTATPATPSGRFPSRELVSKPRSHHWHPQSGGGAERRGHAPSRLVCSGVRPAPDRDRHRDEQRGSVHPVWDRRGPCQAPRRASAPSFGYSTKPSRSGRVGRARASPAPGRGPAGWGGVTLPKMVAYGRVSPENPGNPRIFKAYDPRFSIVFGKVRIGAWGAMDAVGEFVRAVSPRFPPGLDVEADSYEPRRQGPSSSKLMA